MDCSLGNLWDTAYHNHIKHNTYCNFHINGIIGCVQQCIIVLGVQFCMRRHSFCSSTFDRRDAVGRLLKESVNLPCSKPALWGCLGQYYSLIGQLDGAKEALLKQVGIGSHMYKTL